MLDWVEGGRGDSVPSSVAWRMWKLAGTMEVVMVEVVVSVYVGYREEC